MKNFPLGISALTPKEIVEIVWSSVLDTVCGEKILDSSLSSEGQIQSHPFISGKEFWVVFWFALAPKIIAKSNISEQVQERKTVENHFNFIL